MWLFVLQLIVATWCYIVMQIQVLSGQWLPHWTVHMQKGHSCCSGRFWQWPFGLRVETFQIRKKAFGKGHQCPLIETNQHATVGRSVSQKLCPGLEDGARNPTPSN